MQSTATASAEPAVERMDLYELRDDLARSFAPANAHERMLVTQIAQSFLRLQKAQNAEAQYFEKKGVFEAITTDFNTYKAITRYTSDCERAWRHAVLMLERTQRRRIKTQRSDRITHGPQPTEAEPEITAAESTANAHPPAPTAARASEPAPPAPSLKLDTRHSSLATSEAPLATSEPTHRIE